MPHYTSLTWFEVSHCLSAPYILKPYYLLPLRFLNMLFLLLLQNFPITFAWLASTLVFIHGLICILFQKALFVPHNPVRSPLWEYYSTISSCHTIYQVYLHTFNTNSLVSWVQFKRTEVIQQAFWWLLPRFSSQLSSWTTELNKHIFDEIVCEVLTTLCVCIQSGAKGGIQLFV